MTKLKKQKNMKKTITNRDYLTIDALHDLKCACSWFLFLIFHYFVVVPRSIEIFSRVLLRSELRSLPLRDCDIHMFVPIKKKGFSSGCRCHHVCSLNHRSRPVSLFLSVRFIPSFFSPRICCVIAPLLFVTLLRNIVPPFCVCVCCVCAPLIYFRLLFCLPV